MAPGPSAVRSYAVIVAANTSLEPGTPPLRYADDDGARYHELLSLVSERAEILSVLDPETQAVFPAIAKIARPPVRRELLAALASVFEDIERDNRAGHRTALYFVYAGHGTVGADGEGAMHLLDGRFSRSDLFQEVIAKSPARVNHLIIDACNAYLMVARRGGGAEPIDEAAIEGAVRGFIAREGLERYPNTGVLVSTSKAAEVHEWSRFSAGIFSHEVRSALAGAADVNGDGAVTYAEVAAFVSAANARVRDPRAKILAHAAAPAIHLEEPLIDLSLARGAPKLHVPGALAGRRYLEDARGVRYADLNLGPDAAVTVALVPSELYFLRSDEEEIRIPLSAMASLDASTLPRSRVELGARGSEALTFQRDLFAVPFGRAYFEGFVASKEAAAGASLEAELSRESPMPARKIIALGAGAGAIVAGAVAVALGARAESLASDYRAALVVTPEVSELERDSASAARAANVLAGVGGALAAGALALWLWP